MASVHLELNAKPNRDGRYSILFRVTRDRKIARFTSGKKVMTSDDFDKDAAFGKWISSGDPNYDTLNKQLKKQYVELDGFLDDYLTKKPGSSAKEIVQAYLNSKMPQSDNWLTFFDQQIQKYKDHGKERFAIRIEVVRNKWAEFLDSSVISLQETSLHHLEGFETFLKKEKANSLNTVAGNIKVIKQIYRAGIKHALIEKPNMEVLNYSVKTEAVQRDKLTEEEIKKIEELDLPELTYLRNARNCFLFAYYNAGMRFSDLAAITWDNIKEDGTVLSYRMSKTDKLQTIKIPGKAKQILNSYSKERQFIFQLVPEDFYDKSPKRRIGYINSANTLINRYLKRVAARAKIKKRISMHTARHSFAYIGFKKTKDPVAIQSMLKHNKLKETQEYIISLANEEERDILGEIFG